MKKCGYCGRENGDAAQTCGGCGTSLVEEPPRKLPRILWQWPAPALRFAALLLVIILFYFLSFGPVVRYFGKVTSSTTAQTGTGGMIHTVTVRYPGWVSILYYPAFSLWNTEWGGRPYGTYLSWWERKRESE
jgi:hypothetical protein